MTRPAITVVGLGIVGVDQLTREAERAVRSANEVLYADTGIATQTVLESLGPKVTNLTQAYGLRFTLVPSPAAAAMLGGGLLAVRRRRG